ncbi:MFS transporter [Trinickia acidisoli]|uniref:MFS transporter n=1 Tax=Trinickia acidisoli TaxID=2767482 RepID=UPI001A8C1A89|nr:MFS transporter [Trinickia acidisoli]
MSAASPALSDRAATAQIVPIVFFTFICYLIIGLPLPVLPGFVQSELKLGSVLAGAAVSVQYAATLFSRAHAGRFSDTLGPKRAVMIGLVACAASGVLLAAAVACHAWPGISLVVLAASRLTLGFGESCVGTGAILWGIGRVGASHNARVISWNGIATYGGLAIGAPIGATLDHALGPWALGAATAVLAVLGYVLARRLGAVPLVHGERMGYASVFMRVLPHGMALGLGAAGFGSIATFIALYYAARGWPHAALALTLFGSFFCLSRLLFHNSIRIYGGFRVALVSFAFECAGLVTLWLAGTPDAALVGAAVTGFGFALVFPSLGVEAVELVPPASRGAALAAYSVFFDLSLGIMGPLAGYVAGEFGYPSVFFVSAIAAAAGAFVSFSLYLRQARDRGIAAAL